jgi:hypothetical protein
MFYSEDDFRDALHARMETMGRQQTPHSNLAIYSDSYCAACPGSQLS